jgi:RecA-family ATPase
MLVSGLALAIAAEADFLGHPTKQGKVLIVSAEDDREEMIARLHDIADAMGLSEDIIKNNIYVFSTCDAGVGPSLLDKNMNPTELLNEIRRMVDLLKPELVIIDTLAAMAPAGANLIDATAATQYICNVVAGLKPTDGSTGPAVLFTHHLRKPGKDGGDSRPTIHDVRDSGAIVGSMRAVMILHKDTLTLDKCNGRMRVEPEYRISKNDAFQLEWKSAPGCLNGALQLRGKARLDEIKAEDQQQAADSREPGRQGGEGLLLGSVPGLALCQ